MLTVTDPNANVTTYTYNHSNQVLTVTNDLAEVTTYTYDDKGNKLTVQDANAKVTTYAYDDMDRLTSIEDAALETTTYAYDGNGNRTSVTNTRGKTTTYAYDALNRRTSVTDPLSEVTSYTYDAASRLTQRTDARGLITKYLYDNADRLTSVEHRLANNTLVDTITYAYDNANRRTSMVDPAGTTTYAYDNADRLTSVTFPGSQVVSYLYDDAGNRTRITYPDSKQVNYGYDDANRLETVTDWLTNVTTYTYDDAGRLASLAYPNGVDTTYGYDDADRLLSLVNANGSTFSSFAYTLDDVGNRTQVVANNGTTTFDYDDLYRLTEVTYPGPSTDIYTYDEGGNRLTKDATSYTYDDGDRMTAAGGVSYTYDDNGNQTARGTDTFTWDHENRLTQSVVGGVTSSSVYYGNGVRRSHTVNGVTTTYTWDVNASLPVVLQDGTNTYVYGLDLISATDGSGDQVYFSHDGLGSVTDITDDAGVVTDTYEYDVFGAVSAHSGSSASPWKFTGEQHEGATGDTGYYFLRARYYDVDLGRFISRDPIEFDQRYSYAGGNPVLYVDPDGQCFGPLGRACKTAASTTKKAASRTWDAVSGCATSDTCMMQVAGTAMIAGGVLTANPVLVGAGTLLNTSSDLVGCVRDGSSAACVMLGVDGVTFGAGRVVGRAGAMAYSAFDTPMDAALRLSGHYGAHAIASARFGLAGSVTGSMISMLEAGGIVSPPRIFGRDIREDYPGAMRHGNKE